MDPQLVNPQFIQHDQWLQLNNLLVLMYLFAASMVTFALSMLVGHGIIPSLVGTRHLPADATKIRLPLYIIGFAAFIAAIFFVTSAFGLTGVLHTIYPRVVI